LSFWSKCNGVKNL